MLSVAESSLRESPPKSTLQGVAFSSQVEASLKDAIYAVRPSSPFTIALADSSLNIYFMTRVILKLHSHDLLEPHFFCLVSVRAGHFLDGVLVSAQSRCIVALGRETVHE